MRTLKLLKMGMVGLVGLLTLLLLPMISQAVTIDPGYDLLHTEFAQFNFGGAIGTVEFKGLEFGTYDFGTGPVAVGNADTILQRNAPVTPTGTISNPDFEIIALSLISVNPINTTPIGGTGLERVYTQAVTDTGSSITINSDGTFTSHLEVHLRSLRRDFRSSGDRYSSGSSHPGSHRLDFNTTTRCSGDSYNQQFFHREG